MSKLISYVYSIMYTINDWRDKWVQSKIRDYLQNFKKRSIKNKEHWFEKIFIPIIDKSYTTAPNLISIFRGLMALPLFIFILDERYALSLFFFIFIMILDAIDGPLAKVLDQQSDLGEILDPTGDKLVFAAVFLTLGNEYLSSWLFTTIIIIELLIVSMALFLRPLGKKLNMGFKKNALTSGKIKLTLQVIGCGLILLSKIHNINYITKFISIIFVISLVLALITIVKYFLSVEKTTL